MIGGLGVQFFSGGSVPSGGHVLLHTGVDNGDGGSKGIRSRNKGDNKWKEQASEMFHSCALNK